MTEPADESPVNIIITPVRCEYLYTPGSASQKFLKAIKQGRILGQRCEGCGKVYVPTRGACGRCGLPTTEEVEVKDTGTVVTMTIVRVPSESIKVDLPYVAANILLDGADITFTSLIRDCPLEDIRIGMRVQGIWKPESEWDYSLNNLTHFVPLDEPDVPFEQLKEYS